MVPASVFSRLKPLIRQNTPFIAAIATGITRLSGLHVSVEVHLIALTRPGVVILTE